MSWAFLMVVVMALFGFAVVIGIMVMVFRAATRSSGRPPGDGSNSFVPPVLGDASPHHSPSFDSTPSHTPSSFDSGSTSSSTFDSGSSSAGTTSDGSGCG